MSKYDMLDAHTELEAAIAEDLTSALSKRAFTVVHNGSASSHAPAGQADIVVSNKQYAITFEATKSKGAAQDRELTQFVITFMI